MRFTTFCDCREVAGLEVFTDLLLAFMDWLVCGRKLHSLSAGSMTSICSRSSRSCLPRSRCGWNGIRRYCDVCLSEAMQHLSLRFSSSPADSGDATPAPQDSRFVRMLFFAHAFFYSEKGRKRKRSDLLMARERGVSLSHKARGGLVWHSRIAQGKWEASQ